MTDTLDEQVRLLYRSIDDHLASSYLAHKLDIAPSSSVSYAADALDDLYRAIDTLNSRFRPLVRAGRANEADRTMQISNLIMVRALNLNRKAIKYLDEAQSADEARKTLKSITSRLAAEAERVKADKGTLEDVKSALDALNDLLKL